MVDGISREKGTRHQPSSDHSSYATGVCESLYSIRSRLDVKRRGVFGKEERMRRWQRVGVAGALALAAMLLRPKPAGEPEPAAELPARHPRQDQDAKDAGESNGRAKHAE
jgi:hypothetical protein